jgi:hypothetical protein
MALSNAREIRKNRDKYKPHTVGDQSPVKRQLAKIPRRGAPPDILAEDGEDPEAQVELNTWSSQAAYDKARADVPLEQDQQGIDSYHAALIDKEDELGLGHTFDLTQPKQHGDGFKSAMFMSVTAKPGISKAEAHSNIWLAALHGDVPTVEYLVQVRCVPASVRNHWGQTALHCAARNGHAAVLQVLLKHQGRTWLREHEGQTALHLAAYFGHTACVKLLLQYGASTTARNMFGQTPYREAREQANVSGPRGDGPREAAEVIAHAMAMQPDGLRQAAHEDPRITPAFRSYCWDELGEPGAISHSSFPGFAADFPDEEDGFGQYGGVSSILQRIHGQLDERVFFDRMTTPVALAALAPALATVPLLFLYRGEAADTEAKLAEVSWIGSGGTGHWSCCLPWQPAFLAVLVNAIPGSMLPMHVAPLLSHGCRVRLLPIWDRATKRHDGYRHRTLSVWIVGLAALLFASIMSCVASSLAVEHHIHYGWVYIWIMCANYLLLAGVRKAGEYFFQGQLPMMREKALLKPQWFVSTAHTLLALVLPSLFLTVAAGAHSNEPAPLSCCLQIDRFGEDLVQRALLYRAVERYSERVFVFFAMSFTGSHLCRICWEYWECHKMIEWTLMSTCLYSPTALYGTRESVVPVISDFQLAVAFGVINPHLHILAAGNVLLQRYGLRFRNHHFRPHARGTIHPGPAEAASMVWPTPLLFVGVSWLVLPAMGTKHALAAMSSWLVVACFVSISTWRANRLQSLWAKQAEEAWSDEYVAMHRDIGELSIAEAQRRDFLDLGHSNWKYDEETVYQSHQGGQSIVTVGDERLLNLQEGEELIAVDYDAARQPAPRQVAIDDGQQVQSADGEENDSSGEAVDTGVDEERDGSAGAEEIGSTHAEPDAEAEPEPEPELESDALQVQIPDVTEEHLVYPEQHTSAEELDWDEEQEALDPEEQQYLTYHAEHLSRAGTLLGDPRSNSMEVVADRKSLEILEQTLGPQQLGVGHPLGIDGDVKSYYHTRVPPHARLAKHRSEGVIERPQDDGTDTAALGGNEGTLVHHPHSTAKELSLEEALALADAADQTLDRLDRYRAGNGGVGPGKGKYGRRGTLKMSSVTRVLQNVLVDAIAPDSTEIRKKGMIARAKAVGVPP